MSLPLPEKILRETSLQISSRSKAYGEMVTERANEIVNQESRTWTIRYMPLTYAEKEQVFNYLLQTKYQRFIFIDRCNGADYKVFRVPDSLSIILRGSRYDVSFKITSAVI